MSAIVLRPDRFGSDGAASQGEASVRECTVGRIGGAALIASANRRLPLAVIIGVVTVLTRGGD